MAMLTLTPGKWFGWQMLPGYSMAPYFSPIRVEEVTALKTGQGILRLRFFNAFYAAGVQNFEKTLRVLRRHPEYIVCDIVNDDEVRVAIITACTPEFLIKHADPAYVEKNRILLLSSDSQSLLDRLYGFDNLNCDKAEC